MVEGGLDEALRRAVKAQQEAAAHRPEPVEPPPSVPGEFLRVKEAARRLGIVPKSVRYRMDRGLIPWCYRDDGDREPWLPLPADPGSAGGVA